MRPVVSPSVGGEDLVVRAVAAHGLNGSLLDPPAAPLDDAEFSTLLTRVRVRRLTGLLWDAVATGALPATPNQQDRAEETHVRALAGVLVLEQLLLASVDLFEAHGIEARVLKGSAIAHLDFPRPDLRTFGDVDLLVRSADFDRAVALLRGQGHRRLHPEPRPGFDRRFSKGTSFRTADGLEVDLHRTFTMGPFGLRLDLERLWQRSATFELGGRELTALATEERFLHACYHAVLGETLPQLVPLRDLAQIALTHDVDLPLLHDLIRANRAEAVVSRAVRAAWSELHLADVTAVSAWAGAYRTDPRSAVEIAAYGPGSSYASKSYAALRSLPTLGDRAAYVYALLVPDEAYVGRRHRSRLDRLRAGWRHRAAREQGGGA